MLPPEVEIDDRTWMIRSPSSHKVRSRAADAQVFDGFVESLSDFGGAWFGWDGGQGPEGAGDAVVARHGLPAPEVRRSLIRPGLVSTGAGGILVESLVVDQPPGRRLHKVAVEGNRSSRTKGRRVLGPLDPEARDDEPSRVDVSGTSLLGPVKHLAAVNGTTASLRWMPNHVVDSRDRSTAGYVDILRLLIDGAARDSGRIAV